ncbi:MAG: hypothetical protein ACYTAN_15205, partial [Planctomycetota bacterium]
CHGIFSAMDLFALLLEADKTKIQVKFGGTNHFFFITDARVEGRPGYPILAEKLGKETLGEYLRHRSVEVGLPQCGTGAPRGVRDKAHVGGRADRAQRGPHKALRAMDIRRG